MKKGFTKNLLLHIRYPWTASCLLIMWVGLAVLCAIMRFTVSDIITLISVAGAATLIIALAGFRS